AAVRASTRERAAAPAMRTFAARCVLGSVLVAALAVAASHPSGASGTPGTSGTQGASGTSPLRWYKGNTHTHTLNSDGDSTPDDVVRWYREHGYHFVTLTDHNYLTSVDGLNALPGADDQFLVMKGEEVSDTFGRK